MQTPVKQTEFVRGGACIDSSDNRFLRCALDPGDCLVEDHFRGPWQLDSSRIPLPGNALDCLASYSVREVSIGRCNVETGQSSDSGNFCASTAAACPTGSFLPHHEACTVVAQPSVDADTAGRGYAFYEWCPNATASREGLCVWSSSDCAGTVPVRAESCTCDRVRTGACVSSEDPSERFCAVAAETCDTQHTAYRFVPVQELESDHRLRCLLCETLPTVSYLNRYTHLPTVPPTAMPPARISSGGGGQTGGGAKDQIAVVAIAIVVPLFLAMVAFALACRREETAKDSFAEQTWTENKQSQPLPTSRNTNEGDFDEVESLASENKMH